MTATTVKIIIVPEVAERERFPRLTLIQMYDLIKASINDARHGKSYVKGDRWEIIYHVYRDIN